MLILNRAGVEVMCNPFIDLFMAGHRTVNDSQKTHPRFRFVRVDFLVLDSSIARANKDLKRHERHCPCPVRRPRGGALDNASEIKVNGCDRERGILLRRKETRYSMINLDVQSLFPQWR